MRKIASTLACAAAVLLVLARPQLGAQSFNRDKLAFVVSNVFGANGLILENDRHQAHFDSSFRSNFGPFNSALASQLTSAPIPSTAAGFTYAFDSTLGTYVRSAQNFGPIFSERAETIGADRFYFGVSFQHFGFDNIDDLSLDNFPAVFNHRPTVDPDSPFLKDVITSRNLIDVSMGQLTTFFTYGLTDRMDVSVAIPFVSTNLDIISDVQIQRIGTAGDETFPHTFRRGQADSQRVFQNGGSASGLGDVIVRFKGTTTKWENAALAIGADVRLPTGNELDFLGSGAPGFKPFAVFSYNYGRISPRVNVGYQFNGESALAGNVLTGEKAGLPEQFLYSVGVDIGVTSKFSVVADYLGQRLIDAPRVIPSTFTGADGRVFPTTTFLTDSLNIADAAFGFKLNPASTFLVTFNVLVKLNNGGLRDDVVPLIGISFTP